MFKENLLKEYLITTSEEKKEASKLYFSYYNDCEEKSYLYFFTINSNLKIMENFYLINFIKNIY